jgi:hypothetical protein
MTLKPIILPLNYGKGASMQRDRTFLLEMVAWCEIMEASQKAKVTGIDMISFNNMCKVVDRFKKSLNLHVESQYSETLKRLKKSRGLKESKPKHKKKIPGDLPPGKGDVDPPIPPEVPDKGKEKMGKHPDAA